MSRNPKVIGQHYPLYALVVSKKRLGFSRDHRGELSEWISPADVCMVVGWDHSQGLEELVPVFVWIDTRLEPGQHSPVWPVRDIYYELRTALPTEADKTQFAEKVCLSVRKEQERGQQDL